MVNTIEQVLRDGRRHPVEEVDRDVALADDARRRIIEDEKEDHVLDGMDTKPKKDPMIRLVTGRLHRHHQAERGNVHFQPYETTPHPLPDRGRDNLYKIVSLP